MFLRSLEALFGLGLLIHGLIQITVNPVWWAYVPVYLIPALLSIIQMPRNSTWRTLSSLSIVAGGLYTGFLLWTFGSLDATPTLDLQEARNLPAIAFGALLISIVRLTKDKISQPIHYIRSSIILGVAVISFYAFVAYFSYLF